MTSFSELRLTEINAREDLSLRLGDALDIKASISLGVILFLATQTAFFFDKGLPKGGLCLQSASVVCAVLAALFALWELWPVTYDLPAPESPRIPERFAVLAAHYSAYPEAEKNVAEVMIQDEIAWAIERIKDDDDKNDRKSQKLEWSFWFTGIAILANLATVFLYLLRLIA